MGIALARQGIDAAGRRRPAVQHLTGSLFTTETPSNLTANDAESLTLGTQFSSSVNGTVTGMRFYRATSAPDTVIGLLYTGSTTELARVTFGSTINGWNTATFPTPVNITAGQSYIVAYWTSAPYVATGAFFASSLVNGPLTATAGLYDYRDHPVIPTNSFNASCYFADVLFAYTPVLYSVPTAPTAVSAIPGDGVALVSFRLPDNVGGGVSSYTVRSSPGGVTGTVTAPPVRLTGLDNGTAYTFTATATNTAGTSAPSTPSAAVTLAPPTFPDWTNTGHLASPTYTGTLSLYGGPNPMRTVHSNQTFTNTHFIGASVGVPGDVITNMTFRGCLFESNWTEGWNVAACGTNIVFDYCTFKPVVDTPPPYAFADSYEYGLNIVGASSVTVTNCNMYGFGNAFQVETSSEALPVIIRANYIHDAADQANAVFHHDGILSNNGGPQYLVIDGNTIMSGGNTNAIALQSIGAPYAHIQITNNQLSGFGYTVNIGDQYAPGNTDITFTDNTFNTLFRPTYGPLKIDWVGAANNNLWRRNRWKVPAGSFGNPADDGKYWLPDGIPDIAHPGPGVSTDDYTG